MPQVTMMAGLAGGTIHTEYSGVIREDDDGIFTVDTRDGPTLVGLGAMYVIPSQEEYQAERKKRHDEVVKLQEEEEELRVAREEGDEEAVEKILEAREVREKEARDALKKEKAPARSTVRAPAPISPTAQAPVRT